VNNPTVTTDDGSSANADGIVFTRSRMTFRDVTDGSSNTAAFGEHLLGDGVNSAPAGNDYRRRVIELMLGTQTTPSACTPGGAPAWSGQRGGKWVNGHFADTMYNHWYPPNAREPDCHNTFHNFALTSARSAHVGGVQMSLVDGAVRFVGENIDLTIWRALATRSGGEVLGEF
jgi:hypothetical protein